MAYRKNICQPRAALTVLALILGPSAAASAGEPDMTFGWLEGCWQTEDGLTTEVWSEDHGTARFGYAVTLDAEGRATFFEQTLIHQAGENWLFTALTRGNGVPVSFELTGREAAAAIFENPAHDFPQRIRYYRAGDELRADVSTLDNSRGFTVSMTSCAR